MDKFFFLFVFIKFKAHKSRSWIWEIVNHMSIAVLYKQKRIIQGWRMLWLTLWIGFSEQNMEHLLFHISWYSHLDLCVSFVFVLNTTPDSWMVKSVIVNSNQNFLLVGPKGCTLSLYFCKLYLPMVYFSILHFCLPFLSALCCSWSGGRFTKSQMLSL